MNDMPTCARVSLPLRGCATFVVVDGVVALSHGDFCVVETEYGLDAGKYLAPAEQPSAAAGAPEKRLPRLLRRATESDLAHMRENAGTAGKALRRFVDLNAEDGVHLKPLDCQYSLGRERMLIVFGSPEFVDCRRVVGRMQRELSTRIEVRHAGMRDEAAVAGGIGSCGRSLCCATWMRQFQPVNVQMAKTQELPANPAVLNGCCARLKCCLRYEYDVYRDAARGLPGNGAAVRWADDEGVVVGRDVLTRKLLVRTRDFGLRHVSAGEVTVTDRPCAPAPKEETHENPDGEWTESGATRES